MIPLPYLRRNQEVTWLVAVRMLLLLQVLCLLPGLVAASASDNTGMPSCNCDFAASPPQPSQSDDCRVYGTLGGGDSSSNGTTTAGGTLIPWMVANQTCTKQLNLTDMVTIATTELYSNVCPYSNYTNSNVLQIINHIRFDIDNNSSSSNNASAAARNIMAAYPQFWNASNSQLVDTISTDRIASADCVTGPDLCWNLIKDYFASTESALTRACGEFHKAHANELMLQQGAARIALCGAGPSTSPSPSSAFSACEQLQTQVDEVKASNPDVTNCTAFGNIDADASELPTSCDSATSTKGAKSAASGMYLQRGVIPGWWFCLLLLPSLLAQFT
jgi:hypothetical protein